MVLDAQVQNRRMTTVPLLLLKKDDNAKPVVSKYKIILYHFFSFPRAMEL